MQSLQFRHPRSQQSTPSQAQTVQGDTEAFAQLVGYLDAQLAGFYMHQR